MYGGPQQPAFASAMVNLGVAKSEDLNGGSPNCVSFTPDVRALSVVEYLDLPNCLFALPFA